MNFCRSFTVITLTALTLLTSGCATTIAPTYNSQKPDILRIGGDSPTNPDPVVENTGSFCVETTESWHEDGETPDGQTLWAKRHCAQSGPLQIITPANNEKASAVTNA